jgi:hypothetical protein
VIFVLYGKSIKVLKAINYLCDREETTSSLDIVVYFHNHVNDLDLENTIKYLSDMGYVELLPGASFPMKLKPTHIGKHYAEIQRREFKEFLMKSVLTPILIAFITALITSLLAK